MQGINFGSVAEMKVVAAAELSDWVAVTKRTA
jgi:hypothetical protein